MKISGIGNAKSYLNNKGKQLGSRFQKTLINEVRNLSQNIQRGINSTVDRGAVPFTQRAVLFTYKMSGTSVSTSILIKDLQARYLYDVLVKPESIIKFIPTSSARLTQQGNITGLRNNLAKGRYKVVKSGGKERLIDTSKKDTSKKTNRVIGVRETKRRKMVYDFYQHAEVGAILIISNIRGTFKVTKNG